MIELVRDVGSVLAALGALLLLVPIPGLPATRRRAFGLVAIVGGWITLIGTLAPDSAADRVTTPLGAAAIAIGVVIALGVGVGLSFLVIARPWIWFLLLALAVPLRIPLSLGDERANLLVPLYAVIGLGVLAWVVGRAIRRIGPDEDPSTPLDIPLAAFVAFVLVSATWSADPEEAAVQAVFFYAPFTLLYLAVVAWWPRARPLALLATTTIAIGVPVAVLALFQYATRDIFWNATLQQANIYGQFFRVNAIFFDPNILGRYLVVGMLAAVAIAWLSEDARLVGAMWLATAVLGAGLVVTFSRSSALMLLVGLVLIAVRAFGIRRTGVVAALGVALMLVLAIGASESVRETATSTERLEEVTGGRFGLVRGGLSIWREEPVAGAGLGGFETRFEDTLTPTEQRQIRVVVSHNAPVTVLSEQGIVGLALLGVLLVSGGVAMTRLARAPDPEGWAIWTMQAMLLGILVHSLLYSAFFEDPTTWILAAGALATGALARARAPATEDGRERTRRAEPPETAPGLA